MDTTRVIFETTPGGDKWDIEPPLDVSVQAPVRKFTPTPDPRIPELDKRNKPCIPTDVERRQPSHGQRCDTSHCRYELIEKA